MSKNKALLKVVKKVGSMSELGRILHCNKSNISRWANGVHKIPTKYVKKLVELSDKELRREDFRPDVYED